MKETRSWVLKADIASPQQVAAVLKTRTESPGSQTRATCFEATDDFPLCDMGTEQVSQILLSSTAVEMYASGDARVA